MKLSDKILLGFLALVVAAAVAVVVALRAATTTIAGKPPVMQRFSTDSLAYRGEAFSKIRVRGGGWKLRIARADSHTVTVTREDEARHKVRVTVEEGTLSLVSSSMALAHETILAEIATPQLSSLSIHGAVDVAVGGFTEDSLRFTSAGGSQTVVRNCTIGRLSLNLGGFSDVKARECRISEAELHTTGAFGVVLSLDNGTLRGRAEGMGGIEIYGTVSENTLETAGLVDVTYHD